MRLRKGINASKYAARFQAEGRIQIPNILREKDARSLIEVAQIENTWNLVFFANERHFDLSAEGWRDLEADKKATTLGIVHNEARQSFSYMFDNIALYDRYHEGRLLPDKLREVFEFLNGDDYLSFVREVTGFDDITFADAQVTRYGPGQFLTIHDDDVEGKNRRAAYVLNLTENWREDWGGYLQFFDEKGNITGAFKPAFNVLNMFAVPSQHSVGIVAPFAGASRYSITGWLRAGDDPKAS